MFVPCSHLLSINPRLDLPLLTLTAGLCLACPASGYCLQAGPRDPPLRMARKLYLVSYAIGVQRPKRRMAVSLMLTSVLAETVLVLAHDLIRIISIPFYFGR